MSLMNRETVRKALGTETGDGVDIGAANLFLSLQ